ncbi:MAG: 30S ribosomal protein S8 [Deltaproteobacteria bacterium]|nr:30S ribosomal protein S8 [Deltaproteobacteria bacterium]
MVTDRIADLLTRIRNASAVRYETVLVEYSRLNAHILDVMLREGYVAHVQPIGDGVGKRLAVGLKYSADKRPVLTDLRRISTPGRRVYVRCQEIPRVRNGLGVAILSTPRGVLTDEEARAHKVGGEMLCEVW